MATLFGDLLFPDNPTRRTEVNTLHQSSLDLNNQINDMVNQHNEKLRTASRLIVNNSLLRAMQEMLSKSPEELQKIREADTKEFESNTGLSAADLAFQIVGGLALGSLLLKGLSTGFKAAKSLASRAVAGVATRGATAAVGALGDVAGLAATSAVRGATTASVRVASEAASAAGALGGEAAAQGAITAARSASRFVRIGGVAAAGIGVVVSVGLELIFGAIEGSQERTVLEENLRKLRELNTELQSKVKALQDAINTLDQLIATSVRSYQSLHTAFLNLRSVDGEEGKVFSVSNLEAVFTSQSILLREFSVDLDVILKLRKKFAASPATRNNPELFLESISDVLGIPLETVEAALELMNNIDSQKAAVAGGVS